MKTTKTRKKRSCAQPDPSPHRAMVVAMLRDTETPAGVLAALQAAPVPQQDNRDHWITLARELREAARRARIER